MGQTWIWESYSTRTVGSRVILLSCAEFKDQGMLNAIVHTKLNTTINLHGVTRLTSRPIFLGLKLNKVNYAYILSNMQTVKAIIKLTQIYILFGNIDSIENNILKSIKNFMIVENN